MASPSEFHVVDFSDFPSREMLPVRQSDAFRPLGPLAHVGLECLQTTTNFPGNMQLAAVCTSGACTKRLGT
jgi:hypothetical protein